MPFKTKIINFNEDTIFEDRNIVFNKISETADKRTTSIGSIYKLGNHEYKVINYSISVRYFDEDINDYSVHTSSNMKIEGDYEDNYRCSGYFGNLREKVYTLFDKENITIHNLCNGDYVYIMIDKTKIELNDTNYIRYAELFKINSSEYFLAYALKYCPIKICYIYDSDIIDGNPEDD
ncbi:MAG: hypothetical protein CMF62_04040 [Magnetococcales bacterium]|nr:hypothetical protein [Magnetococcales bacterium]|tara:strand:+ start:3051 stop:3584 length:534 start_codon:yes stop_codon:yes gene_type:complete